MATTRALAATGEAIEDSELTVTSALAISVKAFLPEVASGSGATVAAGFTCTVSANAAGDIEIVDVVGRRIAVVASGTTQQFVAHGDANDPQWVVSGVLTELPAAAALASNGTLLPLLGGELTATLANNPASISDNALLETEITVTGAALGDMVIASFDKDLVGLIISAYVSTANTVNVHLHNETGGAVNLASGNFFVRVFKRVGNLPAAATPGIASWMRVSLPDGTVGLVPVFAE